MNIFDLILLNAILTLFPIMIYFVYITTSNEKKNINHDIACDLSLISSYYLTYKFGARNNFVVPILILSVIVLIAYFKNKIVLANILSLAIVFNFSQNYDCIFILIIPYIILLILFLIYKNFKLSFYPIIYIFIILNTLFYCLWLKSLNINIFTSNNIVTILTTFNVYFLFTFIVFLLFLQFRKMVDRKLEYLELEKKKDLELSLFKITHEIKNPIAVCKGYLSMLDLDNCEQVHKYIPIISNEIERLLVLLQDFLLVNSTTIDFDIMDINLLLEETIFTLLPLFKEKNIKFINTVSDEEWYINGDYNRLSQVIINLLKNSVEAIDYTKESSFIKINSRIGDDKLFVEIEDNGTGINKTNLSKIKQPFYTTKRRGSGLGVSLSNEIINAHNGNLKYESEEGIGTKVTIELPLNFEYSFN